MSFGGQQPQSTKKTGETGPVTFDFSGELGASETISTQNVVASVYSGTDANPSAIIDGPASTVLKVVTQSITAGVVGVIYQLLCTVTTSLGRTFQKSSYLAIVSPLT